jgi:cysteine desulfurase family protein (TIGR01976 family)
MSRQMSEYIRNQFPALKRKVNGYPIAYLDGPGGYQVPETVIQAVQNYLIHMNANVGDEFETAQNTEAMIQNAREIFADFFNCSWDEVAFGANMTTLNFSLAQALAREMKPGDTVLITELDHEANRGPWLQLKDRGIEVEEAAMDLNTCTLDMTDFRGKLARKPKVVALNYACNGVGTISDVKKLVNMSHEIGAYTVVDAVHYAAHGPIDVREIDTDFLLCSAYKFFGPHIGVLYAKKDVLSRLTPMNLRTQIQSPPYMIETGTLHHEGIAGAEAAVAFIADAGLNFGNQIDSHSGKTGNNRRNQIVAGLLAFEAYEHPLTRYLTEALARDIPKAAQYGPPDGYPRTSTVSFTYDGYTPSQVAKYLGSRGVFVWAGHFFAFRLVERLGLHDKGGLIRVGIAPYNTQEELDRLIDALKDEDALRRFADTLNGK